MNSSGKIKLMVLFSILLFLFSFTLCFYLKEEPIQGVEAQGQTYDWPQLQNNPQRTGYSPENIDWTITLAKGSAASMSRAELAVLLAHELYHAQDPLLSDSIYEEMKAYQFGDRVAAKHGLPGSGYSGLNPNTLEGRLDAWYGMTQAPNQPAFYTSLSLRPAADKWEDLKVAYEHYQWSKTHH